MDNIIYILSSLWGFGIRIGIGVGIGVGGWWDRGWRGQGGQGGQRDRVRGVALYDIYIYTCISCHAVDIPCSSAIRN